ncbi:uncharacterized protein LOC106168652 [Lingula anatina]|uniref:Uncharacterized protein LOC106168652 n=1 Tax=Lingula anatina TaxID=7574 RepID=A0A2R2MKS3_LINAN|nr:uncharacterized protein LOC106168652 [Lingula anatina]|eukprot:XP_023930657.1 uncharacterized protein LOC106168652 [Lingula anatina]
MVYHLIQPSIVFADAIKTACVAFPREPGIVTVFPAYKANEQHPPFIAVLVSIGFCGDKMTKYEGFTVEYYSWDMPDMEAQRALSSQEAEENPIPPEKSAEIGQVIQNESEDLFNKHRNLTIISASPVKVTGGKVICTPCIVLYCRAKRVVPLGDSLFPESIEGIPVDVREGFVSLSMNNGNPQNPEEEHLGQNPTFYSDPLRVGCSIGLENLKRCGTLGMFVLCEQTLCFLTCYHVLRFHIDAPFKKGEKVCQPSDVDQETNIKFRQDLASRDKNRVCGVVRDFRFGNFSIHNKPYGIDVALVEIRDRGTYGIPAGLAPQTLRDLHLEESELSFNDACLGSDKDLSSHVMFKCGRQTGLTRGMVRFINGVVCRPDIVQYEAEQAGVPILCNELLSSMVEICGPRTGDNDCDSFAERGDSGAAVFYLKDGKPHIVGMVVAKTSYSAALISPIWPIFKLFNIELARIEEDMGTEPAMPEMLYTRGRSENMS